MATRSPAVLRKQLNVASPSFEASDIKTDLETREVVVAIRCGFRSSGGTPKLRKLSRDTSSVQKRVTMAITSVSIQSKAEKEN